MKKKYESPEWELTVMYFEQLMGDRNTSDPEVGIGDDNSELEL